MWGVEAVGPPHPPSFAPVFCPAPHWGRWGWGEAELGTAVTRLCSECLYLLGVYWEGVLGCVSVYSGWLGRGGCHRKGGTCLEAAGCAAKRWRRWGTHGCSYGCCWGGWVGWVLLLVRLCPAVAVGKYSCRCVDNCCCACGCCFQVVAMCATVGMCLVVASCVAVAFRVLLLVLLLLHV